MAGLDNQIRQLSLSPAPRYLAPALASPQHLVTSLARSGGRVSREPAPAPPLPVSSYLVSASPAPANTAQVQRNAIAAQLVQQSLHNSQAQLQRMSARQPPPPPPSYSSVQAAPRPRPAPHLSPYLYPDQGQAQAVLQQRLQNTRTLAQPGPGPGPASEAERTYMNVQPVAMVARNGRVVRPGPDTAHQLEEAASCAARTPAIPQSQEVKHKQEPLYSTLLGAQAAPPVYEETGMYANYAPASLYSNYSNYSELEMLRSCDSHCSADEEHTEGLPRLHCSGADSPVSSSYSELRQAQHHVLAGHVPVLPGHVGAFPGHQQEGDYEPVIPPKVPAATSAPGGGQQKHFKSLSGSSSESTDYLGTCVKCGDRIVGEGTGCSAMGRPYHILCFTCSECGVRLQGLPFYAVDSAPHCQACYLGTLERCCKCHQPILDRILRATGKPYHPNCFTCVVCTKSLDGIPFTVDAANQIHCIEDFHRRFAPRCSVCRQPIMPTPGQDETVRVVALDRSFHVDCYRCVDCSVLLSSEEEGRGCYPLDNDVLCKGCNTRRIQHLTQALKLS